MHTSEYDYLFKLLLIGDSGVGKVCYFLYLSSDSAKVVLVLSVAAFCRRHLHRELHQYYWRRLQDSHNRARGKDCQASDCESS